ncbi:MAG: hypothetical protein U1F65_00815 [Verrucomicrobiota bacterium]
MRSILVLSLLMAVYAASAQIEPLVVTNRDVFKVVVDAAPPTEAVPRSINARGEVLECRSNVVILRTFVVKNIYGPAAAAAPLVTTSANPLHQTPARRPLLGQKRKYGATIALENYPDAQSLTNGQVIAFQGCTAGTHEWRGTLLECYELSPGRRPHQP